MSIKQNVISENSWRKFYMRYIFEYDILRRSRVTGHVI